MHLPPANHSAAHPSESPFGPAMTFHAGLAPCVTVERIPEAEEDLPSGTSETTLAQIHRLEQDLALKDREIQAGQDLTG